MKMNPEENEDWKRALDDSQPGDLAAGVLARTLSEVRRKRRRKQARTVCGVAAFVALCVFVWSRPGTPTGAVVTGAGPVDGTGGQAGIRIQEITDAELLALFPGRAAGFATVNGQREFILLPPDGTGGE